MDRREQVQYLNQTLLAEMPQYREQAEAFPVDAFSQRRLLRSLMNRSSARIYSSRLGE